MSETLGKIPITTIPWDTAPALRSPADATPEQIQALRNALARRADDQDQMLKSIGISIKELHSQLPEMPTKITLAITPAQADELIAAGFPPDQIVEMDPAEHERLIAAGLSAPIYPQHTAMIESLEEPALARLGDACFCVPGADGEWQTCAPCLARKAERAT